MLLPTYIDALDYATLNDSVPNINNVCNGEQIKYGFGLNLEQQLIQNVGVFGRASWADGKTETYAFTEIDNSLAAGAVAQGSAWSPMQDSMGIALVQNGLSRQRRDYLAASGISFFIGDDALNYRRENILETYYSLGAIKKIGLHWTTNTSAIPRTTPTTGRFPSALFDSVGYLRLTAC